MLKQFKTQLYNNGYFGSFHTDVSTRLINATDNSIYEVVPKAVAQPKSLDDVYSLVKTASLKEFCGLCLTPRGGGTGTNGQSLTSGIVIDFTRYMNKVLQFDPEGQTITVEPGIILSDLNRFLEPHGLFFAPDVSTANRATIGGMIATDAAGRGSLVYGKTIDSIDSLKVMLADGYILDTQSLDISQIQTIEENRLKHIYTSLVNWLEPVQDEINKRFPKLKRPLSGYNIKRCYQDGKVDLAPLFAGSEGTLGIVVAAKLKLLPIPKYKTLVVIHYSGFIDALKDAKHLITFRPVAIETVDEKVQKSAQTLPNWPILAKWLNAENKNYISNFVEFVSNDPAELKAVITTFEADLQARTSNYVVITDSNQINQLWSIRSLAVGLAGKIPGKGKPVAFVEDAIVPPEHLADFVTDLQHALAQERLTYAMYGHVDVGCIHVRPALDLQLEQDRQKIRPITEMVIKLLNKYNGILWGEHGKGFRGEFVPEVFGPVLYPILCKIKQLFDPYNQLNPGKLAAPDPEIKLDKIDMVPMRGEYDQIISPKKQDEFLDAMLCNGNGACFNQEPANVMCPSYKVTGDRVHSPKGRAMLVKQWLRERAKAKTRGKRNDKKMAKMAKAALDGCLSCKGCSGKCPTQVSIPDLKTKFLDYYHRKYKKRSAQEFILGYIESLLPLIAKLPRTWNLLNQFKLSSVLGLKDVPLFTDYSSLNKQLITLGAKIYSDPKQIKSKFEANTVVIFADVFTGLLDRGVLFATIELLKKLSFQPYVIYPRASGKSLIVGGFIKSFRANCVKLAALLNPLFEAGIPVIGLENTITLMFRDEVNKYALPLHGKVATIAEFLTDHTGKLQNLTYKNPETLRYRLLPHCTEQAILPGESQLWKSIFASCSLTLEVKNTGCCGMAGSYGYQAKQQQNSKNLFVMHWQEALNDSGVDVLANGYSCRCQAKKQANKILMHPIQVINQCMLNA